MTGIVKVVGHWELGWNTPIKEIDLWEMVVRDFAADEHIMLPISGIHHRSVTEKKNLETVIKENPDLTVVFCDEAGETNLKDFVHPENVLYVFGKTNYSPFLGMKRPQDLSLKVETNRPTGGLLWGHQAAAIILYDRFMKCF